VSVKKVILVAIGVVALAIGLSTLAHRVADSRQQNALDAFYATPAGIDAAEPGTVFRVETLATAPVVGASSFRVLYRTERPDGTAAVSGAMVFVPVAPAPAAGRPVLAYAHGTIGQGRGCAPSRRDDPIGPNAWYAQAIASGFVVVATDYAGIGTVGPNLFLIGQAESLDIVNSVRALEEVPGADPSKEWVVYGHSQGGHSALWTGQLAAQEMPENTLIGVAASAPAADLPLIIGKQWNTGVGWGVGAEVATSWTAAYPNLDIDEAITSEGNRWTSQIADACLGEGVPVPPLLGFVAASVGVPYFDGNPMSDPRIAKAAAEQTPKPLPATLPLLIAQGTADTVIPPESNAALQESWCAAGSNLTMLWLGGVGHVAAGTTAAPTIVPWLRALFDGATPTPQCSGVPPVAVPFTTLQEAMLLVR
jgi:pimeloyl-ACP methyl ester carboxylesterase